MAADEARDDLHLIGIDPELRGKAVLCCAKVAGRLVHRQLITIPPTCRARQLDRVVMLDGRRIATVNSHRRARQRTVEIALPAIVMLSTDSRKRLCRAARISQSGHWRLSCVADAKRSRSRSRDFRSFSHDDRDDLAGVSDFR